MSNQLVKRDHLEGYRSVFPKTFIDAIKDRNSGMSLAEILQGFNMYFLSYNGNKALTRCSVPHSLRKEGLWITYVLYDHTVITEWYNSDNIDDEAFGNDDNWRQASNMLVGDVSVSADGYWVIKGEKTSTKAQGETGITPLFRFGDNNRLQASYNEGKEWEDISGDITNNLKISKYIGINEALPTSGVAEGTIYMKGPYYDENDTNNDNPIYRMWVYAWKDNTLAWQDNGEFTSISAGVVQNTGNNTTQVMSQDATTRELAKLSAAMSEISNEMSDNLADLSDDLDILRTEPTQEELIGEDTAYEIVNNASSQIGVGGSNYKGKLFSVKRNDKITITGEVVDGLTTIALCSFVESFEIGAKADILRASLPKGKVNIEYLVPKTGYIFVQTQFSSSLMIEGLSVTKEIKGSIQTEFGKEYNKDAYIVNAYIDNGGKIVSNDSYRCTDFIPMLPTTIRFSNIASSPYFSSIAFYDKNKNTLLTIGNKGNNVRVTASDIPHNATYFRVCSPTNLYEQSAIIISPLQTAIIERIGLMNHLRKTASVKKSTFNSGEQMSLQTPIVAKNKDISFYGRVSSFNRITIQSGNATAFARCKVAIDSTHIYLYSSINSDFNTPINAYLHGLTISEFIDVKIKVGVDGEAVVYLSTLSGEFEQKISDWSYCYNTTFVTNGGSSLSDCALSFSSSDFSKDIWLVGDSYLTYWTPFARVKGYDNFLQMGRPGSASEEALQSLLTALNYGTPKTIIWAIGMNNADEGGINAIWKSCLDSLIEICSSKGIELILSTIPNTPSKDNSYKNAVVRESGYRYVDICSAVGADSSSSWYSGLLGYDPHPSEVDGSRVIANRFIADIPEIRNL